MNPTHAISVSIKKADGSLVSHIWVFSPDEEQSLIALLNERYGESVYALLPSQVCDYVRNDAGVVAVYPE